MRKYQSKLAARIEKDPESDDLLLTVPDELIDSGEFKEGDEIEMKTHKQAVVSIRNLSCRVFKLSRFRRNLNSLMKQLENQNNHLKRVLVTENGRPAFWLFSYRYYEKIKRLEALNKLSELDQELKL
jgi:PHD/YefM family antitoxin component YafN of YafNO toxin-antitoxin module